MAIGYYNIFGRSPTDGGDQQRQKLSLATRRRTRQGPKRALFDAEVGVVDGAIVAESLRSVPGTIWDFVDEYTTDVLSNVTMRRRALAAAAAAARGATRSSDRAHEPIDFLAERARLKRASSSSGSSRDATPVTGKRGRACCETDCAPGEPKRPRIFCPGCKRERDGCSGWYHEACYWKRHCSVLRE
jgi:hypothetical protein